MRIYGVEAEELRIIRGLPKPKLSPVSSAPLLNELANNPRISSRRLATILGCKPGSMHRALLKLKRRGDVGRDLVISEANGQEVSLWYARGK